MKNVGIELEFFVVVKGTDEVVPAYKVTSNLDGNPFIGELKTNVHTNIYNLIYELKSLIHKEKDYLNNKGYDLKLIPEVLILKENYKNLRRDKNYVNTKDMEILDPISIYNKNTGKVLAPNKFKASLQINLSDNTEIEVYSKIGNSYKVYNSNVFNYSEIIKQLDITFNLNIKATNRVKGVYTIKDGIKGKRIEYRSLPNNIDLDILLTKLIQIINDKI